MNMWVVMYNRMFALVAEVLRDRGFSPSHIERLADFIALDARASTGMCCGMCKRKRVQDAAGGTEAVCTCSEDCVVKE